MEFHYVGLGTTVLFIFLVLLVFALLFLLKTAIKILGEVFEKRTGKNIFYPLMFVTGFPVLIILFRQSVTMGLLAFVDPDVKLYTESCLLVLPLIAAFFLMYYILKNIANQGYFFK